MNKPPQIKIRFGRLLLIAGLLVAFISCPAHADTTGTITGHILDIKTGAAIPGATIYIQDTKLVAVANPNTGDYIINDIPSGVYRLRCSAICYLEQFEESVYIDSGSTYVHDFWLIPDYSPMYSLAKMATRPALDRPLFDTPPAKAPVVDGKGYGSLTGTVRDMQTGLPISCASVMLNGTSLETFNNPVDGTYLISNIPSGIYSVVADCIVYNSAIIDSVLIKPDSLTVRPFALVFDTSYSSGKGIGFYPFDHNVTPETVYDRCRIDAIPQKSIDKVMKLLCE